MNEKFERWINRILIFFVIEIVFLIVVFKYFNEFLFFVELILLIASGVMILLSVFFAYYQLKEKQVEIQQILGKESKEALLFGDIGLVTLDDNYNITWMSDLFDETESRFIGEKISSWIPEISELIRGSAETITIPYHNRVYTIARHQQGKTLFFKDVSRQENALRNFEENKLVLGLVHLDNYEEETQYEDEQQMALFDTQFRQPIIKWAKEHGMYIRRIRSDRFLLVLNEKIFSEIMNEHFSILNIVKKNALKHDLSITVSMGLSRGTSDFGQLEELSNQALSLTQGRGGDQVAVKEYNKEVVFYGTSSQAYEKESKVRVRVMAHTLRDLVLNSKNVIIVGHKNMDFDCLGSAIGFASIVKTLKRPVAIVTKTGGLEAKVSDMMMKYETDLSKNYPFVSESEALDLMKPSTLLLMVDHHSQAQCSSEQLLQKAKKIAIIDHHRRLSDFEFNPVFAYIETACSSAVEMITELFEYHQKSIKLTELEATIMYTGMVVDTNHFRNRTGFRTFDAAAYLRQLGANTRLAESFLKSLFDEFELKSKVISTAQKVENCIVIAYQDQPLSRTLMSQIADEALMIRGIEASFVIGQINAQQDTGISARSNGQYNVQTMMEQLGGGGHFNAAAYQSSEESVSELETKVIEMIKQRGEQNESNLTE